jgi:hypothetical protein
LPPPCPATRSRRSEPQPGSRRPEARPDRTEYGSRVALPWGLLPYDACRSEQRPAPGMPARLCCVFRLSQPLDALFRPQPLRPCFVPVTPLGFRLQRVPLPGSGCVSRRDLPSMPFAKRPVDHLPGWRPNRSDGFEDLRTQGVRAGRAGVTRVPSVVPLLTFTSSRCSPHRPRSRASTKPPLMGFHTALNVGRNLGPSLCSALQSLKEPMERLASCESCLPP